MTPEEQQSFINKIQALEKALYDKNIPVIEYIPIYNFTDSGIPFVCYYLPQI